MKHIKQLTYILAGIVLIIITGCDKTDQYNTELNALPQINFEDKYAYKTTYMVGKLPDGKPLTDTMTIVGKLQPQNGLTIRIGDAEAQIISTDTTGYDVPIGGWEKERIPMDIVKVLITEAMGTGENREVSVTTGGYTIKGVPVNIFSNLGKNSLAYPLKAAVIKTDIKTEYVYFECINGKGDVYYYDPADKSLHHITKSGQEGAVPIAVDGDFTLLAGSVNPQGTAAWFSVRMDADGEHRFYKMTLPGGALIPLMQGSYLKISDKNPISHLEEIAGEPYEGKILDVKTVMDGVYAGADGKVYLRIPVSTRVFNEGGGRIVRQPAYALAVYNEADGSLHYLLKGKANLRVPGIVLHESNTYGYIRLLPDENALYVNTTRTIDDPVQGLASAGVVILYDLRTLQEMAMVHSLQNRSPDVDRHFRNFMGSFRSLMIPEIKFADADDTFGWLPMPGKRMQALLYQYYPGPLEGNGINYGNVSPRNGFPQWGTFDFKENRVYQYAPGRFDTGGKVFGPTSWVRSLDAKEKNNLRQVPDELLNYDEEGMLYMTTDGRKELIKTEKQ